MEQVSSYLFTEPCVVHVVDWEMKVDSIVEKVVKYTKAWDGDLVCT
jgi:hypothetical protein